MIFKRIQLDINDANCYILACPRTREALLIDPGEYHRDITGFIRTYQLDLKYIFITHAHYDHASGIEDILRAFGGKVLVHQPGYFSRAQKVIEGHRIRFGYYSGLVLQTPGHTDDSISLHVRDMVFSGDSLFCGSVGSTVDRESHRALIKHVRRVILPLGDHTKLFPGHGPASTVGIERMYNPYLLA
jgi:glyoxylase-like metal-dependent hydrolase (beta-lactamase superfamily II)